MPFKQPENIDECEERIANLTGEEAVILAQLNDQARQEMPAYRFMQWKSSALERKSHLIRERKLLEVWRKKYYRQRQEILTKEKAARRAAVAAKQQQKQNAIATTTDEVRILADLYRSLVHIADEYQIDLNEKTLNTLHVAEEILIRHGVFTEAAL